MVTFEKTYERIHVALDRKCKGQDNVERLRFNDESISSPSCEPRSSLAILVVMVLSQLLQASMASLVDVTTNSRPWTDHYLSQIDDDLTDLIDLDLLKLQLKRQRKVLFTLTDSLVRAELSYESTVARADYERLADEHHRVERGYHRLKEEYQRLGHTCLSMMNRTHELIDERNEYYDDWQQNRTVLTPRPDWDKVANVIDGHMERWKFLATGKSSDQLVDVLLQEIIDGNQTTIDGYASLTENNSECFQTVTTDTSTLPFLRAPTAMQLVNRRLKRRTAGLLIKEIWYGAHMSELHRTLK